MLRYLAACMLLLLSTPAIATTMNLTYSTQNGRNVVDAVLTVDPAMFIASDGRRAMRITGITGTRNKLAITGLAPASPGDSFDPNQLYFLEDAPFGVTLSPLIGAVPEPGTWLLMLLGFGAIGLHLRRRAPDAQPSLA